MGKRKRSTSSDRNNKNQDPPLSCPAPDAMPCSSGMELLSKEKSSHLVESSELKSLSSVMDSSVKLLNAHHSIPHHHHNLGRQIFLKRSRHYYGHQYSRRNSVNHAGASTSHAKILPLHDERISFKLASQCNSDSGCYAENREKAYLRPERIRSRSLVVDAVSLDVVKMMCEICQKLLRRKPCILGHAMSSNELSVIAVLVCGHVYHADCLEQRTCIEDRRDPPCPLCAGLLSEADTARDHE